MTDAQVAKILAEGDPIASVLLSRGGWLKAAAIHIEVAFPADDTPAVWAIDLCGEEGTPWHRVFVEASHIIGISIRSYDASNRPLDGQ